MASFNLIDEPWIPCMTRAGPELLGIQQALANSHQVLEIADPSPLVTLALHRVLLAILHRVFGPQDVDAWGGLWERGFWDMGRLSAYLDNWRERFDLFSETHPFFQAADLVVPPEKNDAHKLVLELSPSNSVVFSHVDSENPPALSPAEAARALVAAQPFHRSGTVGSKYGGGPATAEAGPLAGAAVCLLTGTSLFETLTLNMVRYSWEEDLPFRVRGQDMPIWERDEPPDDVERLPYGYLDWLTWNSWIVRLAADETAEGTVVRRAKIVRGCHLPKGEQENTFETMVAYTEDDKGGYLPISLRRDRAVWRDSSALFRAAERNHAPKNVEEVARYAEQGPVDQKATYPLLVSGVGFEQANALFWREEHLPLPLAYLEDAKLFGKLQTALALAEDAAGALRRASDVLAAYLLHVDPNGKLDKTRREALNRRRNGLGLERRYWGWLDPHFWRFVVSLAAEGDGALGRWGSLVLGSARRAYEEVAEGLGSDGDVLRVEIDGRAELERGLGGARRRHPFREVAYEEAS